MASTSGGSNAAPNPTQSDTAVDGGGVGRDIQSSSPVPPAPPSRYESQKRRDWNTFLQYLRNHKPPLSLSRCSGAHVIEFLKYLDQFGKTKVHITGCTYFGHPNPPAPCTCPLKQAWGSLDALIGRLRAAYEENGGRPESNPFGARAVRIYLREVRESQAKARGIPYEKKKRKRLAAAAAAASSVATPALEVSPISTSAPVVESLVGSSAASGGGDASSSSVVVVAALTSTCTPTVVVVASSAAEFS